MIKVTARIFIVIVGLALLAVSSDSGTIADASSDNMSMPAAVTVVVPPPSPGGGSSPSGGGSVAGETRHTYLMYLTTPTGRMFEDVEVLSVDVNVVLLLKKGSVVLNRNGFPLSTISVTELTAPPEKPAHTEMVGSAYDITPSGASFGPPEPLTLKYDGTSLLQGILEKNLFIATWSEVNNAWESIGGEVDPALDTITASVNHLCIFTIMAGTRPAALTLSDLKVNPSETGIGGVIAVSAVAANNGDLTGDYDIALKINDEVKETRKVRLDGNSRQTISFSVTALTAGTHSVDIGGLNGSFRVKEPAAPPPTSPTPAPASFTVSNLSVTPAQAGPGEVVTVAALVTNTGGSEGSLTLVLKVNDTEESSREAVLGGGQSETVTFTTAKAAAGRYTVKVNDLAGEFEVTATPTLPSATGALPEPPARTFWPLGSIIAGIAIITALFIYLVKSRRRKPTASS